MAGWRRRKPGSTDCRVGTVRDDYITLDGGDPRPVFMCWREGARLPQSYHRTEASALALARRRAAVGQTIFILRAEIVGGITIEEPRVTGFGVGTDGAAETRAPLAEPETEPKPQPEPGTARLAMFPMPVKPPIG